MSRALWWNHYCELAITVRSILFGKKLERSSEDLKAGTFNLRKSATGSNGDAFGSEDVIENFKHWLLALPSARLTEATCHRFLIRPAHSLLQQPE